MSSRFLAAAALAATALFAAPSQAAVIASLTFDQPTGIVGPGDSIDIYLTLSLDPASDAVTTDGAGRITSGFTDDDITDLGGDPQDPESWTYINVFFQGGDSFTGSGAYTFDFYFAGEADFIAPANLDLQPGGSISYLFGTFTPVGGAAPNGTYAFFNSGVTFNYITTGMDDPLSITVAETCPGFQDSCAFTRTVVGGAGAVPEPGAWALMILGFGGVGAMLRRRQGAFA